MFTTLELFNYRTILSRKKSEFAIKRFVKYALFIETNLKKNRIPTCSRMKLHLKGRRFAICQLLW